MHDFLTPKQVAEYLQLNTGTVYRLIRQNHLVATQIGRTYRIPRLDLERFLNTNSNRGLVADDVFERMMAIANQNQALDSDDVLEALEQFDLVRKGRPELAKAG